MVDFARLKSRAKEKGRTYKYLCDQLGREKNYLSNCAVGADKLSSENLALVADLLETTPAYLLGETDEKEKPTGTVADGLSDKELKLVEAFRGLSPEEQDAWMLVLSGKKTPQ
uniref:helix-turn-helix domain-containing protein n=1 Tax=Gemmiger formicilis TaxID=745368 RepID=UPI004025FD5D